ncbi:MAG: histidine phosphatase family protein [Myxococcota bacterium]
MPIFLIRHGETPFNAARVVQMPSTPLSERGLEQAARLATRLAGEGVARILSSDYARAAMTAERVRQSTAAPLELEPLLQERNYGDIRGTPYAELDADIFAADYVPPRGESWEVFHARVDAAWARVAEVAERTAGNLAVVTHGLVCYSLALHRLVLPRGEAPRMSFANASLTVVESAQSGRVQLLDCTAHLEGGAGGGGRA